GGFQLPWYRSRARHSRRRLRPAAPCANLARGRSIERQDVTSSLMYERRTRINNPNRFKLGLFAMNCSCGSIATTAPEQWRAGWEEHVEAARLADAAGLDFLLPVARWHGYGGLTDRQGASFPNPNRGDPL